MKFLIVLAFIGFFALTHAELTAEQQAKWNEIKTECKEKTGVSTESIEKARKGEAVDDPKLKATALCIHVKTGIMTEDGEIAKDVLTTKLNNLAGAGKEEKVKAAVEKCAVKKSTPEDTAADLWACIDDLRKKALEKH